MGRYQGPVALTRIPSLFVFEQGVNQGHMDSGRKKDHSLRKRELPRKKELGKKSGPQWQFLSKGLACLYPNVINFL